MHYWYFLISPHGHLQTQGSVWKLSLEALVSTVLKLLNMNFGYCVQYRRPLKKHYWYFLIPPSGPASGSRGCWKMESGGPGIQSFGAFNINFVYFAQHTCPLKKTLLVFFDATPRPVSGSRRCRKMGSWGHGIYGCPGVDRGSSSSVL